MRDVRLVRVYVLDFDFDQFTSKCLPNMFLRIVSLVWIV